MHEYREASTPDDFVQHDIDEKTAIIYLLAAFEGMAGAHSRTDVFNNSLYGESHLNSWSKFTVCYCLTNFLSCWGLLARYVR